MVDRELRKLNRRELLKMLLLQCEESERIQKENDRIKEQMDAVMESYERLKKKLDVKDERLNHKDVQIELLKRENEELKAAKNIKQDESIVIAEALNQLNKLFEDVQKMMEKNAGTRQMTAARRSFENGGIAAARKSSAFHGQIIPMNLNSKKKEENLKETAKASGAFYG